VQSPAQLAHVPALQYCPLPQLVAPPHSALQRPAQLTQVPPTQYCSPPQLAVPPHSEVQSPAQLAQVSVLPLQNSFAGHVQTPVQPSESAPQAAFAAQVGFGVQPLLLPLLELDELLLELEELPLELEVELLLVLEVELLPVELETVPLLVPLEELDLDPLEVLPLEELDLEPPLEEVLLVGLLPVPLLLLAPVVVLPLLLLELVVPLLPVAAELDAGPCPAAKQVPPTQVWPLGQSALLVHASTPEGRLCRQPAVRREAAATAIAPAGDRGIASSYQVSATPPPERPATMVVVMATSCQLFAELCWLSAFWPEAPALRDPTKLL
jgi:hypothetical protein